MAVRELTDALADRLRVVSPDYSTWSQADLLRKIGDVVARSPQSLLPEDTGLADRELVARALAAVDASGRQTGAVAAAREAYRTYQGELDLLGLDDAQVAAHYRTNRLPMMMVVALAKVAVAAPFALVGVVVHAIPYGVVKGLSLLPGNEGMRATVKILGSMVLYVASYLAVGLLVGRRFGAAAGIVSALSAPLCGYVAVLLSERVKRVGDAYRGARAAHRGGGLSASVLAHRAAVVESVGAVLGGAPSVGGRDGPPVAAAHRP